MADIKSILKEFGLNEKEVALYLTALSLGETGMSELAQNAGLKRTSAYLVFKSLENKGLMGSFKMKSGLRFVATRPELLVGKTRKQLEEFELILPELKALETKSDHKPKITYYQGREGYLTAAEDSLKVPNITLRHIGALLEAHKIVGLDYDTKYYIPQRLKKHISFKALYFEPEIENEIKNRNHVNELREIRYLPERYLHKTSMLIYGEKVVIFSTQKELVTIIIESKDIAESEKKKFDLIWDLAKNKNDLIS